MEKIKAVHYARKQADYSPAEKFGTRQAEGVRRFHASFPEYAATPLVQLPGLAAKLGVKNIYLKDESYRFGLNAFKVLGGSYALGRYIAQKLHIPLSELTYAKLVSSEVKQALGDVTFVTATDGNHGRGVAWTANRLGQHCVVYMPKGSAAERLHNIQALGAEASISELNYDDAVRLAAANSARYGWVMVQDTAWEGYEEIPTWIMQGYTTMAHEVMAQLAGVRPTHIFLQAGVGALAGAVTGFFTDLYKDARPIITIVEPNAADCIYQTGLANDGSLHPVTGDLRTIMAGLACGEPCTIGWEMLRRYADNFVSMPDEVAATGMRVLARPCAGDKQVISGESGAATMGLVAEVMQRPELAWLREQLKLDANSIVLCLSTEGATDRENYRKIVDDL